MAACAAIRGAPVSPREPPATTTWPEANLVESPARRGSSPATADLIRPILAAIGAPRGMPMSIARTSPAWRLPGMIHSPGLLAWKVTVTSACTASPETTPVDASTPLGTSTATTAPFVALTSADRLAHRAMWLAGEARAEQRIDDHARPLDRRRAFCERHGGFAG